MTFVSDASFGKSRLFPDIIFYMIFLDYPHWFGDIQLVTLVLVDITSVNGRSSRNFEISAIRTAHITLFLALSLLLRIVVSVSFQYHAIYNTFFSVVLGERALLATILELHTRLGLESPIERFL